MLLTACGSSPDFKPDMDQTMGLWGQGRERMSRLANSGRFQVGLDFGEIVLLKFRKWV